MNMQKQTQRVTQALSDAGLPGLHVDADRDGTVYLDGAVTTRDDYAAAVQIALQNGATRVLAELRPDQGHEPLDLERYFHVGNHDARPHHDAEERTAAQRILGASDLTHRLFDAPARTLQTGVTLA